MKRIATTLLTACIGGAIAVGGYKLVESKYANGTSLEEQQKVYFTKNPLNVSASTGNLDFTQAAAAVTPGVVHIKTTYKNAPQGGNSMEDMFNDFFGGGGGGRRQMQPPMASGSGVIVSQDGYIVTNNHVVEDATNIDVILPDKRSFTAKVVGRDPNTDLALIKVSGTNLPVVKLGDSDNVRVGEWVLAVGYPFTLNTTVTAGIVSAKGRSIGILGQERQQRRYGQPASAQQPLSSIESFIQTDAAINRGNSGGALVNANGELIGINAAIASQSGSYEGYGFAIPINLAKKILDDFMKYGSVKRGYLGVTFATADQEDVVLKEKGIKPSSVSGVYITGVSEGSAAAAAGIKEGDIITSINGTEITSSSELSERVARYRPNDRLEVGYERGGKDYKATVTLKGEESLKLAANTASSAAAIQKLGASFTNITPAQKQRYRISGGVVVSGLRQGGLFDSYGIPKGMIITSINGKAITKAEDIGPAVDSANDNLLRIQGIGPNGEQLMTTFPAE